MKQYHAGPTCRWAFLPLIIVLPFLVGSCERYSADEWPPDWRADEILDAARHSVPRWHHEVLPPTLGISPEDVLANGVLSWFAVEDDDGRKVEAAVVWIEYIVPPVPFEPAPPKGLTAWTVMRLVRFDTGWHRDTVGSRSAQYLFDRQPRNEVILREVYSIYSPSASPSGVPLPRTADSAEGRHVIASGISEPDWEALTDTIPRVLWLPARNFVR